MKRLAMTLLAALAGCAAPTAPPETGRDLGFVPGHRANRTGIEVTIPCRGVWALRVDDGPLALWATFGSTVLPLEAEPGRRALLWWELDPDSGWPIHQGVEAVVVGLHSPGLISVRCV